MPFREMSSASHLASESRGGSDVPKLLRCGPPAHAQHRFEFNARSRGRQVRNPDDCELHCTDSVRFLNFSRLTPTLRQCACQSLFPKCSRTSFAASMPATRRPSGKGECHSISHKIQNLLFPTRLLDRLGVSFRCSSAWSRIMPTSYHEAANALQLRLQATSATA